MSKSFLDDLMRGAIAGPQPDVIIVSSYMRATFTTFLTADAEKWNWRRTKRELRRIGLVRKGVRREYHRYG